MSFSYATGNCTVNGFSGLMNYNSLNFTSNQYHRINRNLHHLQTTSETQIDLANAVSITPKFDNEQFMPQNVLNVVDVGDKITPINRFHPYAT